MDLVVLLLFGLGATFGGAVGVLALTRIRRQRLARRRVVEQPNSRYTPVLAQESMARHRWHQMALGRIHEINRAEVVRLLAKVEACSAQALSVRERDFLDTMADLAGS